MLVRELNKGIAKLTLVAKNGTQVEKADIKCHFAST
jgi:hypothetical protein